MAIEGICTVGSRGQKAELVDGSLVCRLSVQPAVRLILALQPYAPQQMENCRSTEHRAYPFQADKHQLIVMLNTVLPGCGLVH